METWTFLSQIFQIFIAFCLFTTLYGKGNPLRSWAEYSYLAAGTAMSVMWAWTYIRNHAVVGLQAGELIWIPAIILGLMMWFRIHPKYSYISRLPIAFTMGIGMGWTIRTNIFTRFITQISATIVPLFDQGTMWIFQRTVIAVGIITMMSFFIYTTEIKGPHLWSATFGEYFMYLAFGAVFAGTFMGRLGLFVGHMQSYMFPVWKQPYTIAIAILVFVVMLWLDRSGLGEKLSA
jgi:hypothetical protein